MTKLNQAMCGRKVDDVFAADFDPGVIVTGTEQLEKEFEKGLKNDDIDELPSKLVCCLIYCLLHMK